MNRILWILGGVALLLAFAGNWLWRRLQVRRAAADSEQAMREFRLRREHLEARFFQIASTSGKPRGLEWTQCDFDNNVAFARDRASGELVAFVGVTISFAAIEGGGMEDVEAVSNLRAATAVFVHRNHRWETDGRVLFNLTPKEAIERMHPNLEMVAHEEPSQMQP